MLRVIVFIALIMGALYFQTLLMFGSGNGIAVREVQSKIKPDCDTMYVEVGGITFQIDRRKYSIIHILEENAEDSDYKSRGFECTISPRNAIHAVQLSFFSNELGYYKNENGEKNISIRLAPFEKWAENRIPYVMEKIKSNGKELKDIPIEENSLRKYSHYYITTLDKFTLPNGFPMIISCAPSCYSDGYWRGL